MHHCQIVKVTIWCDCPVTCWTFFFGRRIFRPLRVCAMSFISIPAFFTPTIWCPVFHSRVFCRPKHIARRNHKFWVPVIRIEPTGLCIRQENQIELDKFWLWIWSVRSDWSCLDMTRDLMLMMITSLTNVRALENWRRPRGCPGGEANNTTLNRSLWDYNYCCI